MSTIRNAIRSFLQKRGYDIVKIDKPGKEYKGVSEVSGYTYHPTPVANYYLPGNVDSDVIANHMKRGMIFEPDVVACCKKYIQPGTAVLDVGANFGQMSIEFSKLTGQAGKVYSFEAQKAVFDVLELNVKANSISSIECIYGAVYNQTGNTLHFPEPDFSRFSSYGSFGIDKNSNAGVPVNTITIDSLQIKEPVSFIKIDVQGSDLFAMQGAKETILKNKAPVLFEFEQQFQKDFDTDFDQYVNFVKSINYKFAETIMGINFLILPA
jgi:FkbM family methyltransferase